MPSLSLYDLPLVVLMVVATWTDVRTMKIRNWLTFPTLCLGLAVSWLHLPAWWTGLAGAGVALVACLPLFRVGPVLSAGDVKMIVAAGAFLGPEPALRVVLFSVALILPVAMLVLTLRKRWGSVREVLRGDKPATMLFHAPVISAAILLARLQPLPELW